MKKTLALLLTLAMLTAAALAESGAQTRQRDITVEDITQTIDETLYTSASGYSFWLQEGWSLQEDGAAINAEDAQQENAQQEDAQQELTLNLEETAYKADVFVAEQEAQAQLTLQPSADLTAQDADDSLTEATYREDAQAVVGEIEDFALDSGATARRVEVRTEGVVYRYYFLAGDGLSLCVTAQFPEADEETYGARMEEMVASVEFTS